jgi:hypothetical protein
MEPPMAITPSSARLVPSRPCDPDYAFLVPDSYYDTPAPHADLKHRLAALFEANCRDDAAGCWVWGAPDAFGTCRGAIREDNYGAITVLGATRLAHRTAAWVFLGGFELADPDVDVVHIAHCRSRRCCDWDHLLVVKKYRNFVGRVIGYVEPVQPGRADDELLVA